MRWLPAAAAAAIVGLTGPVVAQSTLNRPVGEIRDYGLDSGRRANYGIETATAYADMVWIEDAAWVRLYFEGVELEKGSFIRIMSLLDGEIQVLDAAGMAMWNNSSAYFNGSAVLVELVAAPRTRSNRFVIDKVASEGVVPQPVGGLCGICGSDDRVQSFEDWAARMFPAGCTASVFNQQSCMVSAGHCITGNDVMQFNVPNSTGSCVLINPPIATLADAVKCR